MTPLPLQQWKNGLGLLGAELYGQDHLVTLGLRHDHIPVCGKWAVTQPEKTSLGEEARKMNRWWARLGLCYLDVSHLPGAFWLLVPPQVDL